MNILHINSDVISVRTGKVSKIVRLSGVHGTLDRLCVLLAQLEYPEQALNEETMDRLIVASTLQDERETPVPSFTAQELKQALNTLKAEKLLSDTAYNYFSRLSVSSIKRLSPISKQGTHPTNVTDSGTNAGTSVDSQPMTDDDDQYSEHQNEGFGGDRKKNKPNLRYSRIKHGPNSTV